jgi:hypothetical protein
MQHGREDAFTDLARTLRRLVGDGKDPAEGVDLLIVLRDLTAVSVLPPPGEKTSRLIGLTIVLELTLGAMNPQCRCPSCAFMLLSSERVPRNTNPLASRRTSLLHSTSTTSRSSEVRIRPSRTTPLSSHQVRIRRLLSNH